MALFSFGKKDKNPSQDAESEGKAIVPPKIQTPPPESDVKTVKPAQPAGLIPAPNKLPAKAGVATTQPIIVPRTGAGNALRPARPTNQVRSTQRIVLPPASGMPKGGRASITAPINALTADDFSGTLSLPMGMILRSLPQDVLAGNISQFEASGAAAQEISLPIQTILSQIPSGKIEMTLQDLLPYVPEDYLQSKTVLQEFLGTIVQLPLMDVVMRIPPDLLALRSDQKEVDSAVTNMPDPFTEEILREQAQKEKVNAAKIIEESQVSTSGEEFVPSAKKPPIPLPPIPVRSSAPPVNFAKITQVAPDPRPAPPAVPAPPMPAVAKLPMPPTISRSGSLGTLAKPGASTARVPMPPLRPADPGARPSRSTAPVPSRAAATMQIAPPVPIAIRPSAKDTSLVPPTPGFRPPTPLPTVARAPLAPTTPPVPKLPPVQISSAPTAQIPPPVSSLALAETFQVPELPPAELEPEVIPEAEEPVVAEEPMAPAPEEGGGSDELQRLAALAMAAFGDDDLPETAETNADVAPSEPEDAPEQAVEPEMPPQASAPVSAPAAPLGDFSFPKSANPIRATPPPSPRPLSPASGSFKFPSAPPIVKPVAPAQPAVPVPPVPKPLSFPSIPSLPPAPVPIPEPLSAATFNLNSCTLDDLAHIPGCDPTLAQAIIAYRTQVGLYRKLEDLFQVPGMTKEAYALLTGESPEIHQQTINELLGFPAEQEASPKDITERICCWPDVSGCVLGQRNGLLLVGHVPPPLDKDAVVAFVPKMFEALNKSFSEISGRETDEMILPTPEISYHILRKDDLYLIILSRLRQMPSRHLKVARFVLNNINLPTS